MRTAALFLTVLFEGLTSAYAQDQSFIAVSFAIDGQPASCTGFKVELNLDQKAIRPRQSTNGFAVPRLFKKPPTEWTDKQFVDISLTCSGRTFVFRNQHPAFIQPGSWKLGIAHPLYAITQYGYTHEFDRGAWLGYLIFEGEPGVVTFASQPDPPKGMAETFLEEQKNASGGRARDIAYTLAVFNVTYAKNRDYLLSLLNTCLLRPKTSPEDDECDGQLLDFITNLYWRGDKSLLPRLLVATDTRRDVIGSIGIFYADLLDRRGAETLVAIGDFPAEQQQLICRLAYEDDLNHDPPKRGRIVEFLGRSSTEAANRCAAQLIGNAR